MSIWGCGMSNLATSQVDVLNVLVDCTCWPRIFNLWSQHIWAHLFHATCNIKSTLRGFVSMSSTIKLVE